MKRVRLDDLDRKILAYLQENPSSPQAEIAKKVGVSQPTVGMRIKKLIKMGVLERRIGIPAYKFNLRLAMIGIKTRNPDELVKKFEGCPRLVFMAKSMGAHQLIMHFIGSCDRALQNLIEERLSNDSNVIDFDVSLADTPDSKILIPLKIPTEQSPVSPCGVDCAKCRKYVSERCSGCPASTKRRHLEFRGKDVVKIFMA